MPHQVDPTLRDPAVKMYAAIREAWLDYGKSPSQIELRDATGYSITTVVQSLKVLRDKGYIVNPKFGVRSIQLTDWERTLSNKPVDPWAALSETKFWKPKD